MIQLTPAGTVTHGFDDEARKLKEEFDRQRCVQLLNLIEPHTVRDLQSAIECSEFYDRIHQGAGTPPPVDLCMRNGKVSGMLSFLVNDPAFLTVVQYITGCQHIGSFNGVVYRLVPGRGYDTWHDDVGQNRLIAMSVNLSNEVYRGGLLQIREKESGRVLHEVANTGAGDAIVFRVAPHLQHRVTEIEGTEPRTAFAGWFLSEPEFLALVKGTSPSEGS